MSSENGPFVAYALREAFMFVTRGVARCSKHLSRARTAVFVVALALLFTPQPLVADDLVYRDRGNRIEGHRRVEVGAPAFEALSFVRAPARSSVPVRGVLDLSFFLLRPSRVRITARELAPIKQYQMVVKQVDWPAGWNTFAPWETARVIEPLGVQLTNVGVLAQVESDALGPGEIVAVTFSRKSGAVDWPVYEFQFRAKYDVETASYQVDRNETGLLLRSGALTDVIGGAPASIRFDLSRAEEGVYRLTVDCVYRGRQGGPQRTFVFYHKP